MKEKYHDLQFEMTMPNLGKTFENMDVTYADEFLEKSFAEKVEE